MKKLITSAALAVASLGVHAAEGDVFLVCRGTMPGLSNPNDTYTMNVVFNPGKRTILVPGKTWANVALTENGFAAGGGVGDEDGMVSLNRLTGSLSYRLPGTTANKLTFSGDCNVVKPKF